MSSGVRGPAYRELGFTRPPEEATRIVTRYLTGQLRPTRYVCSSCKRFHLRPDLSPEPRCPHCLEDLDPDADEITAE